MDINRFIKEPLKKMRDFLYLIWPNRYLTKKHFKEKRDVIKVGFIVQMPELWDKQSSVYCKMCKDKRFETWLIIVPKYNIERDQLDEYGSEKDYFISNCLNGNYILSYSDGEKADISSLNFDYLFFQRPYDFYLPKELRSSSTVRFTKNCYIPYATSEMKNTCIYPVKFFRNIYIGFMEDSTAAQINTQRFQRNCDKGIQRFLSIGYPTFEKCMRIDGTCNYSHFLWTPRWRPSASHFMDYYKQLTDYRWGENELTVRPHPMMWDTFLKNGVVVQSQVDEILSTWEIKGIHIDHNQSIEKTFEEIDVMISDKSSIIPMFFLTGKPIIFCPIEGEYGALFESILPGLYVANTWEELSEFIKMLSQHQDPLYSVRKRIIYDNFICNCSATDNIVNAIIDDYNQ